MIGTVGGWLKDAAKKLSDSGADAPGRDAQLILVKVLGIDELNLLTNALRVLQPDEQLHANSLLSRRLSGEPIAYVIGYKEFYGLKLDVDERVLIPRPETEKIVDWVVENYTKDIRSLLDVGTGSGAIALAIKKELPNIIVTATDISEDAIKLAKINAKEHNLEVGFKKNDLLSGLKKEYDIICANLPYIDKSQPVSKEVANEPRIALFADGQGLKLIKKLILQASKYKKLPFVLLEHDPFQLLEIEDYASKKGFKLIKLSEFVSLLEPKE